MALPQKLVELEGWSVLVRVARVDHP